MVQVKKEKSGKLSNEDIKLWLGLNRIDTAANLGTIPFLIAYFFKLNIFTTAFLFSITTASYVYTVYLYFTHYDKKYSKDHWEWNKWLTVVLGTVIVAAMVAIFIDRL